MENVSANPAASLPGRLEIGESLYRAIHSLDLTLTPAAAAAGIDRHTLSHWQQVTPGAAVRLAAAREQFREAQLTAVMLGRKNWRAAAWLLERIFPADYRPRAAERARFRQAEADAASAADPAFPSETVLQNPAAASPATPIHSPQMTRDPSVTPLQNSAPAPRTPAPHASPFPGNPSETLLQKSRNTPSASDTDPAQRNAPPSDPVLQNPVRPGKPLSRKARRAVERNQQRRAPAGRRGSGLALSPRAGILSRSRRLLCS